MPGPGDRGGKKEKPQNAKGALRRLLQYILPFRWQMLLFCLCALLSNLGNLLGPKLAGHAINAAAAGAGQVDFPLVLHYALQMLLVYVFSVLLSFIVNIGMVRLSRRVAEKMRGDVFDKLMRLPVSYFDRHQTGDIISRLLRHLLDRFHLESVDTGDLLLLILLFLLYEEKADAEVLFALGLLLIL